MRGCIDCKHFQSELDWDKVREGIKPCSIYTCSLGHTDVMNKWWEDNKTKMADDKDYIPPACAEMTDTCKLLQSMLDKTKEIIETIKKI